MAKHANVDVAPAAPKAILSFRYFCHGCTKAAAYSVAPHVGTVTCPHCGTTQQCKSENWIALSDEEKAEVNK